MKKRLLTCMVLLCFLLSSIGTAASAANVAQKKDSLSEKTALLTALGLFSEELLQAEDTVSVSRAQLAFSCAGLLQLSEEAGTESHFVDVPKEHAYFSAIETLRSAGLVSGKEEGRYFPEAAATVDEAVKILMGILGYDELAVAGGGYPEGYRKLANSLRLYKDVYGTSGELSKKNLVALVSNVLDTEPLNVIYDEGVKINSDTKASFLENNLKVYRYSGKIVAVNGEDYSVDLLIEKNKSYEVLPGYEVGQKVRLDVSTDIDVRLYENVPMEFWITEDDEIVLMLLKDNISVQYCTIYSVNNDTDTTHKYRADKINEITLLDDETEYDVSDDFTVKFNGKVTIGSVGLIGSFAKVVMQGDEVLYIESWDMTEGGIISDITYENISYRKGAANCILEDFHRFTDRNIIIDGEGATADDVKAGSCFSYWVSEDEKTLVMAISDVVLTDVLHGYDDESVDVGNMNVDMGEYFYSFTELTDVRSEAELSSLLNLKVSAYLDASGRVAYLVLASDEAEKLSDKEFAAYLRGVQTERFDEVKMSIYPFRKNSEEMVLDVSDKVKFEDGLTKDEVFAAGGTVSASSVFKFALNDAGEIYKISKMNPYYGYGEAVCTPASFPDVANAHMYVNDIKLFFDNDTVFYALYEDNNELTVKEMAWKDLRGKYCSGITVKFYGEEEESDLSLALITGNVGSITKSSSYIDHGILTKKTKLKNENDEVYYKLSINDKEFVVTEELGKDLTAPSYIRYSEGSFTEGNDIIISESFAMNGGFYDWQRNTATTSSTALKRGIVKKLDGKRLYLEDGSVYFFYPGKTSYLQYGGSDKWKKTTYQAIGAGEEIVYSLYENCVYVVLFQ